MELNFALFVVECMRQTPDYKCVSWARGALSSRPELLERVASFWGDGLREWLETLVLARRGDVLFDETPERFLGRIDELVALPGEVPALESEPPEVRGLLAARIERLRGSQEVRDAYASLLREVWGVLEPAWRSEGLPAARQKAARIEQQLAAGADLRAMLPPHHFVLRERHAPAFQAALERGEVYLVPLAMAGMGQAYFAQPGAVIVAFGPDSGAGKAALRTMLERAAGRFRVLSDPTRLWILYQLSYDSHTVTDVARAAEISQPTASVHVKALREAGLIETLREDGRTTYRGSNERTREFVEQALGDMTRWPIDPAE